MPNKTQWTRFHDHLMERLGQESSLSDEEVYDIIDELLLGQQREMIMTLEQKVSYRRDLFNSIRKLDVLQELLDDPTVTEIMVNGPDTIFIEREGKLIRWKRQFSSREKLEDVIQQIVGRCNRVINEGMPIVDARLENGDRVNAVINPVALAGPILTIRRFPSRPITMNGLVKRDCLPSEVADFLKELIRKRYSMIIGGGTSAGKTTFLNALSNFIPEGERVITIEDNAELQIQGIDNLVRLEAKAANMEGGVSVTIRDLIKSALRMRPDRIIVGEVRSGEALDMLQALNTGHDGSLCTAHANSTEDMVSRLEMMVLMGVELPLEAIRRQVASGIDILVHLERTAEGLRRVREITEVKGYSRGRITMNALYRIDGGQLRRVGELTKIK